MKKLYCYSGPPGKQLLCFTTYIFILSFFTLHSSFISFHISASYHRRFLIPCDLHMLVRMQRHHQQTGGFHLPNGSYNLLCTLYILLHKKVDSSTANMALHSEMKQIKAQKMWITWAESSLQLLDSRTGNRTWIYVYISSACLLALILLEWGMGGVCPREFGPKFSCMGHRVSFTTTLSWQHGGATDNR